MAVDYFLQITGIQGESRDAKHKDWIEVESWSWGVAHIGPAPGGTGADSGKASFQDFHFATPMSKASPKMFLAVATGQHFKEAKLVGRKVGKAQQEFLTYTLSDVLISSYQTGASESADISPLDSVSLNAAKVVVSYKAQKADGSLDAAVTAGFDVKANKAL
jgi:type VI secretion system secreted protein Hcp